VCVNMAAEPVQARGAGGMPGHVFWGVAVMLSSHAPMPTHARMRGRTCKHACALTPMHPCVHTHARMHTHAHTCTHAHTHIHTRVNFAKDVKLRNQHKAHHIEVHLGCHGASVSLLLSGGHPPLALGSVHM